ncbi:MAG: GTP-binding protein [Candidatus Woesearchaeota archaeon]
MEECANINMVIVGHVDHGKSTLIGRLLFDTNSIPEDKLKELKRNCSELGQEMEFAFIADSLKEEIEYQFTMDTTQVFFKTKNRKYTIIDAPGHKELIKNMITGASQAEAGILIIDAKEGVKEQTKRHAYLLNFLGISQIIVVINKMDLVNYDKKRFEEVKSEILKFLNNITITPMSIIPITARDGDNIVRKSENMPWYDGNTLAEALDSFILPKKESNPSVRMVVQDVYDIDNQQIIVGRLESGRLKVGDNVIIVPYNTETRVSQIHSFLKQKYEVNSGESVGISIEPKTKIDRGCVICNGAMPIISKEVTATIFWISETSLNLNEKILLRLGPQKTDCSITEIYEKIDSADLHIIKDDNSKINFLEICKVKISTSSPLIFDKFEEVQPMGRFVLVLNNKICGGGII